MKNYTSIIRIGLFGGAAAALLSATSLTQAAQTAQDDSDTGEAASARLDSVVVVGSRRSDATVLNSSAPVEVVTAEQLTATGASNLSEALQHLVPSFHFPTSNPSSNAASFVRGVSLRGLATDETLVLVNGKRRHATAQLNASTTSVGKGAQSVDLNSIPLSAIERVEVLLDGAAAQYGSDAIAGVINIILKENDHGGEVSSTYGQNAKGDGLSRSLDGNYGLALPGDGFLSLSFDAWNVGDTDVSATDTRQMYFSGDRREASAPQRNWFYGSGASKRYNFVANAEAGLTDAVRAYGFATYGYRHDEGFGNLRRPQDDQTVRGLYPEGFQPKLDVTSEDFSSAGGLKIDDGSGGRFDLSATYGRNRVSSVVSNTLNTSLGLASPDRFDTGDLLNEQSNLNLDYVRPIDVGLLKNPVNLATGLTYRHEGYQVFEGDVGSWINGGAPILDGPNAGKASTPGSQGFGGFSPDDAGRSERNVYGGYIDLENKVTDRLNIGIAGRSEHYSDFGWTTTGKLSARYELTPDFALRSTFSSGYRAPSLGQEAYSRTIPNVVNGVITTTRVARADSDLAKALGATELKPEKSTNLSAGFVYKIGDRGSLTVDAYQINIHDRIVLTETLSGTAVRNALISAGFPTFSGLSYFTNGADTKTRGVDVVARYRLDNHGFGDTDLTAAFNASRTKITSVADNPSQLASSGLQLIGHQARSIIERSSPDTTLRLGATHTWQKWTTDLNVVRYGTYELDNANTALDQTFSAQWVTNLRVSYRLLPDLKLSVGANNLFDTHPDEVKPGARNPLVNKYSGLSPEGGAGAFYYTSLSYDF